MEFAMRWVDGFEKEILESVQSEDSDIFYQAGRDRVCAFSERMAPRLSYVRPQGAYYVMVKFPPQMGDSVTTALRLLHEARVMPIPGSAFGPGGEGHVWLSFGGTEAERDEAMERLAQ